MNTLLGEYTEVVNGERRSMDWRPYEPRHAAAGARVWHYDVQGPYRYVGRHQAQEEVSAPRGSIAP